MRRGFTLIELLVAVTIIAVLGAVSAAVFGSVKRAAYNARCVASLSQLGSAVQLYLNDHNSRFFPYAKNTPEGKVWYFGLETSPGSSEGDRELDRTAGPLAEYIDDGDGKIEVCPAFDYGSALWKPKFRGASWGYGYNWWLGGGPSGRNPKHITEIGKLGQIVVLGDCAQVNTFQSPASPSKPMLEEFYIINDSFRTIHFRHGKHANFLFADGHVEGLRMADESDDSRIKGESLGRIDPEHLGSGYD